VPVVDRWLRGAAGEERVGAILDALHDRGWRALHDVDTGRGNIDHVLVGPGGVLSVETKSHRGRVSVEHLDERMFKQAYAQAKHVERITGQRVAPLLVFSDAYLDRPVSRRRGVTVLPARMLAGHLGRRTARLSAGEVDDLYRRLAAALG
jgi:Nuclease-related domain